MKPLPKIVQWQLQKALSVSALPHPDADQLTAFMERSVSHAERTAVLEHLSQCSECRQVAAFAEAPVTFPAVRLRSAHSWRPVFAWSMVAASVLVVAAFLLLGRANQRKELAEAVRQSPLAAQDYSRSASPVTANTRTAETAREPGVTAGPSATDLNEASSNRVRANEANSKKTVNVLRNPDASSEVARDSQPQAMQAQAMQKIPAEKDELASPGIAAGAVSAKRQAAAPAANAAGNSATDMRESFAPSVPNTAVPTSNIDDRYPRWTLNSDGTLLRSLDTGASWQKISIPGNAALLHSIATVGTEVWVGGAKGALYHSADEGGHWMQVNPARGGELLSDDVISIEFATAQRGKFVTSKQEVWTTADGGQSWSKK
jgi:hypothetical protein